MSDTKEPRRATSLGEALVERARRERLEELERLERVWLRQRSSLRARLNRLLARTERLREQRQGSDDWTQEWADHADRIRELRDEIREMQPEPEIRDVAAWVRLWDGNGFPKLLRSLISASRKSDEARDLVCLQRREKAWLRGDAEVQNHAQDVRLPLGDDEVADLFEALALLIRRGVLSGAVDPGSQELFEADALLGVERRGELADAIGVPRKTLAGKIRDIRRREKRKPDARR